MKRAYVDTSAYLCLLLGEEGASEVADQLDGASLHSSVLLVLECRRNLVRLARTGQIAIAKLDGLLARLTEDASAFSLKELDLDLCNDPTMPAVATPRSLDLAHLRTAMWFHRKERLDVYVTRDAAQAAAARELGLPV